MGKIEELTIKQLRELIGRKVKYRFFHNNYEETLANDILIIESVRVHDDLIGIRTTIDLDDEYIVMDDKDFDDFVNGKVYTFECGTEDVDDDSEEWFQLINEEEENESKNNDN